MKNTDEFYNKISKDYAASLPELTTRSLPLSFKIILKYLTGKTSPARALTDSAVADLMPKLEGEIIEIGGTGNYKNFANPKSRYILSNITPKEGYLYLDAMNMSIPDNSVDNFMAISVLEHIPDPWKAIKEIHRTLKPGGRLLIAVPFIYPFHADPSDFFRYSDKGLAVLLKDFKIIHAEALGNIFSTTALFLQKPFRSPLLNYYRKNKRPYYFLHKILTGPLVFIFRIMGIILYMLSFSVRKPNEYACMYCLLSEKK